jgi:RNA polymerase sigma-70 factor (ECF subfamily)
MRAAVDIARQALAQLADPPFDPPAALVEQLAGAIEHARQSWPGVRIDPALWCRYLAARLPPPAELPRMLPRLSVDELYLCCACAAGEPRAVAAFQQRYLPLIDGALLKLRLGPGLREEVRQQLAMRLLVADEGTPPLLAGYAGTGKLGSWLRVVTARVARRALEQEKRVVLSEDDRLEQELVAGQPDAELRHLKAAYREAFRHAFRHALGSLRPREITLLRQRFVDGLSLERIGAVYRVHHTTARRWLEKTRLLLLQRTVEALAERLQISKQECSTIIRLIQSDMDLTLHTLLKSPRRARR